MPRGERFKITDAFIDEAARLASRGLTYDFIANALGVSRKSFERYMAKNKRLKFEMETARAKITAQIAETLIQKALSGNMTAIIFYLKTRGGFIEKRDEEFPKADIIQYSFNVTDPNEAAKVYQEIMTRT